MSDKFKSVDSKTVESSAAQINQAVNNAVAALMDVANMLRDIPKIAEANSKFAARLIELGEMDPKTGQLK